MFALQDPAPNVSPMRTGTLPIKCQCALDTNLYPINICVIYIYMYISVQSYYLSMGHDVIILKFLVMNMPTVVSMELFFVFLFVS